MIAVEVSELCQPLDRCQQSDESASLALRLLSTPI